MAQILSRQHEPTGIAWMAMLILGRWGGRLVWLGHGPVILLDPRHPPEWPLESLQDRADLDAHLTRIWIQAPDTPTCPSCGGLATARLCVLTGTDGTTLLHTPTAPWQCHACDSGIAHPRWASLSHHQILPARARLAACLAAREADRAG